MDDVVDFFINGKVINIVYFIRIGDYVIVVGQYEVRMLFFFGIVDIKVYGELILYVGGE